MYLPSTLFRYSYQYAKRFADKVYILSAKHGLISEDMIIEPYDLTLKNMTTSEKITWSNNVILQLIAEFNLDTDDFIVLAGVDYSQYLLRYLKNYKLPLGTRPLGMRISYLKETLCESTCENNCLILHELFNSAKKFAYNEIDKIPFENGIYIVFEKGEMYNMLERVVRIGTHDSPSRLKARLKDHFLKENKDGSIFIKNIGKSMLNKNTDTYLETWSQDTSKQKNKCLINVEKQRNVEKEVSIYLQNNFSFACFRVDDKNLRLRLEKGIISTIFSDDDFLPSDNWLGKYSPVEKIKQSGLWLTIGLDAPTLKVDELNFIINSTSGAAKNEEMADLTHQIIPNNFEQNKSSIKFYKQEAKITTNDICKYIQKLQFSAKDGGESELVLVSGDIHKALSLNNKMPSVCSAMYSLMNANDAILATTPSVKSSTIKIKYYF